MMFKYGARVDGDITIPEPNDSAMAEAFNEVGVVREETLAEALIRAKKVALECYKESKYLPERPQGGGKKAHDPIKMMRLFDKRARVDAMLIMAIVGEKRWNILLRCFLELERSNPRAWKHSDTFRRAMKQKEKERETARHAEYTEKRERLDVDGAMLSRKRNAILNRDTYRRKVKGIKRVWADVDVKTGAVRLIDKEFGPYAHIRLGGLRLSNMTTPQVLQHLEKRGVENKFMRALCQLIPDPRKPIGEQWTPGIIKKARDIAEK